MAKAKRKSARLPARKSRSKSKTKAKPRSVTVAALKRAVEGRDAQALADMYADDAVMLVIDHDNPPSSPRRLAGKAAISSYFGDVCGRDMTHLIEIAIAPRATGSPSPKAAPIRTAPRCFARRCSTSKAEGSRGRPSFRPGTAKPETACSRPNCVRRQSLLGTRYRKDLERSPRTRSHPGCYFCGRLKARAEQSCRRIHHS